MWTQITSICSSKQITIAKHCKAYALHGTQLCGQWADQGSLACAAWADQGYNACAQFADQGYSQCCDWAPCSWACKVLVWISYWVCVAWYWVANLVCQAWYWLAHWVCAFYYWLYQWVCLAWSWLASWVCVNAKGGPLFLMTDGTVLMNEFKNGYGTRRWWRLNPSSGGSYSSGVWTQAAPSHVGRTRFASAVLADGRLLVCGGEASDTGGTNSWNETNACEIYDPTADTWTQISPPPGVAHIGASPCCLLPDGRFLLGSSSNTSTWIYDPTTGGWTPGGSKGDIGKEETWVLRDDGTVLVPQGSNAPQAEQYHVATNTWGPAGQVPVTLVQPNTLKMGPGVLTYSGSVYFAGTDAGLSAFCLGAGAWTAGPTLPLGVYGGKQGCEDAPAVLLPDGSILLVAAEVGGNAVSFYQFNGGYYPLQAPPNSQFAAHLGRMMLLPTGEVLWVRLDNDKFYLAGPSGPPSSSWRPVLLSAPASVAPGGTVTITGTQFNGLSQAVAFGNKHAAATNYPLVRLRDPANGNITYCRTSNHALAGSGGGKPAMGVATGATLVSTQVFFPSTLAKGMYEMVVVANGIPSQPREITVDG